MVETDLSRQIEEITRKSREFAERGVGPGRLLVGADLGGKLRKTPLSNVRVTLDGILSDAHRALANALLLRTRQEVSGPFARTTADSALDAYRAYQTATLELAWLSGDQSLIDEIIRKERR